MKSVCELVIINLIQTRRSFLALHGFTERVPIALHGEECKQCLGLATQVIAELIIYTLGCPHLSEDAKAAYKSGEILDQSPMVTLDNIKRKLKESGVFDPKDTNTMDDRDRKELGKLFEAVEIMTTSRNRQPSSVQNVFSSLRLVERAVKKLLKEGQISESLASKFHWDKLSARHRRDKPSFTFDPITKMRMFNTVA